MTSKTTKFYSTAIAAALVATAVVPAASAADGVTAVKGEGGKYTVTVTADPGAKVNVYELGNTTAVGTGEVAAEGSSVAVQFTVVAGKTYSYKITPAGADATEGAAVSITIPKEAATALGADKITLVDSPLVGKDTITVKGLDTSAANVIKVYTDEALTTEFTKFTGAKGKEEVTFTIKDKDLNSLRAEGSAKVTLYVTVETDGKTVSEKTAVTFDLAPISEKLDVDRLYVDNNLKGKDTVTVSGVKAKDTLKFYDATSVTAGKLNAGATPIVTQKVSKSGAVTVAFKDQFTATQLSAGLYVTLTSDGSHEGEPVHIATLPAEKTTDAPAEGEAFNLLGNKQDTVKVTGLDVGATINVYAAASVADDKVTTGATAIGTGKANKFGEVVVKLKDGFSDADVTAKKVYITATNLESLESLPTEVELEEEPVTEFDAIQAKPKVGEDEAVTGNVTVNNLGGLTKDTIEVNDENLVAGITVNVYAPADVTAATTGEGATPASVKDKAKPIGTAKVDAKGKAIVKIKGGLEQYEAEGEKDLYISAVEKNKKASELTPLNVYEAPKSTKLNTANVLVENGKDKKADTITVKGAGLLAKGDVVSVYAASSVSAGKITTGAKPIATAKVSADGADAVLKIKEGFTTGKLAENAESTEKYYVTLEQVNKNSDDPLEVTIEGEEESKITEDAVDFTNNNDLKDTLTIKNDVLALNAKDVINVYAGANETKPIATATVKTPGQDLVITFKENYEKDDTIYVTYTKSNTHESTKLTVTVGDIDRGASDAALIDTNFITVDDNDTKDATVTVANAKAGVKYTVYGADDKEIGSATASKNGILVVKLTKGTTYATLKDKKVSITAREYAKAETDKVEIQTAKGTDTGGGTGEGGE